MYVVWGGHSKFYSLNPQGSSGEGALAVIKVHFTSQQTDGGLPMDRPLAKADRQDAVRENPGCMIKSESQVNLVE